MASPLNNLAPCEYTQNLDVITFLSVFYCIEKYIYLMLEFMFGNNL